VIKIDFFYNITPGRIYRIAYVALSESISGPSPRARRSKGGGSGARAPERRSWTLLQSFKNAFLSRNLDQSMLKNVYFFGKNLHKICFGKKL